MTQPPILGKKRKIAGAIWPSAELTARLWADRTARGTARSSSGRLRGAEVSRLSKASSNRLSALLDKGSTQKNDIAARTATFLQENVPPPLPPYDEKGNLDFVLNTLKRKKGLKISRSGK